MVSASYVQRGKALTSPHHNMLQSIYDIQDYTNIYDDELLQVSYGMLELDKRLFVGVPISATEMSILANHQEVTSNP